VALADVSQPGATQAKPAAAAGAPAPPGTVETVAELGLTLTLPAELTQVEAMGAAEPDSQQKAAWSAHLGAASIGIFVYAMPREEFGYFEPDDVSENIRDNHRKNQDARFVFEHGELVNGAFGLSPFASLGWGAQHAKDGSVNGTFFVLGGLETKHGYALEVEAKPALDEAGTRVVLDLLRKGVSCACKPRDPQWSDAEVKARWLADAPPALAKKLEKAVRTKHFVFLSNTDAAKQMGESMEKFYATIQKLYPFPEVAGRRSLPVFLFRTPEQYQAFFAAAFKSTIAEAQKSKGVASRDFYATYYDAPQDPVHLHEATHQIFSNRLRLDGGGSWFQEGVAEFASTAASDRTDASNLVKKGRHLKLAELLKIESLLWSPSAEDKKTEGRASGNYCEAALLIEFVHDSKWSRGKFQDWIHAVGVCPPNDVPAIERATHSVLGVDLAGFEEQWVEYCKDR